MIVSSDGINNAFFNKARNYKSKGTDRGVVFVILRHHWGMTPQGRLKRSPSVCLTLEFPSYAISAFHAALINCWLTPAPHTAITVTFYLASQQQGQFNPFLPLQLPSSWSKLPSFFFKHSTVLRYTSFSDELADRSTSWASKNSETDSDMESRLSLEACWVRGIPICSPACRKKHIQTHEMFTVPCYDDTFKNRNRPEQTQTPSQDNTEFILQHVYPCQRASSHPFLISHSFLLTLMSGSA